MRSCSYKKVLLNQSDNLFNLPILLHFQIFVDQFFKFRGISHTVRGFECCLVRLPRSGPCLLLVLGGGVRVHRSRDSCVKPSVTSLLHSQPVFSGSRGCFSFGEPVKSKQELKLRQQIQQLATCTFSTTSGLSAPG